MLAIVGVLMLNVACDDKQNETLPAMLTLTSSAVMDIDAEGGELVISYDLTNVASTDGLQVITAAEWIEYDKSALGRIVLTIEQNAEDSARTAPVIVTYADQRFDVEVRQAAQGTQSTGFVLTSSESVEVNRAGGSVEVTYTIANDIIGEEVSVVTNAEWVGVVDRMSYQKVVLSVALNNSGTERSTTVDFYYGTDTFSVTITQSGDGEIVLNAAICHGYYYGEQYSPGAGNYWIILTDNGFNEQGAAYPYSTYYRIDAYGEIYTGSDVEVPIPVGTYTLDMENSGDKGTFSDESSSYFVTDANGENKGSRHYESGTLVVEQERMTLTVVIDGLEHKVIYEGRGKLLDASDEQMVYTTLTEDYEADLSDHHMLYANYGDYYEFGYQNWMVVIEPNEEVGELHVGDHIQLDIITAYATAEEGIFGDYVGADVLKSSSYIYGFVLGDYMEGTWYFSQGERAEMAPLRKGDVRISDNGDGSITIDVNAYDDLRNNITATWVGMMPESAVPTVSRSMVIEHV